MSDPTEETRRAMVAVINANPNGREALEARYGQVWNTDQLTGDFDVTGFAAPMVVVTRKADKKRGTLMFQHGPPRLYWGFQEA